MSDPVKNSEIEDVLSSIRRLVSENHVEASRPAAKTEPVVEPVVEDEAEKPSLEAPAQSASADRLVLSPALRVEEIRADRSDSVTSPVEDTPFANSLKEDILPLRESLPSFLQKRLDPAASDDHVDRFERDTEVDETDDAPLTFVHESSAEVEETPSDETGNTVPFPAPEELTFETARGADPVDKDARPWEIEGERLSEWHSVRAGEPEHFEPDGPEDGENAGTPVATLNWEDHEIEDAEVDEVAPVRPTETVADPIAEQIAETVVEDIAPSEDTIDAQQYDAVLDEEMLRELVGEIVRQELQGPLGERITRNVRKLVRREINRALTARNFNDS